jgi:nucleoside-diphosphate-sugar epimerase
MKVFLTGASGYIGGSVAKVLIDAGHEVFGLVRNQEKARAVANFGVRPVIGTLEDQEILIANAANADAVIHTANSDHRAAVETFIETLTGTGKVFIHTSGSSVVGDDVLGETARADIYTEETPFVPMNIREERVAINNLVRRAGIDHWVRTVVIVPSMAYGNALGLDVESDQLPVIFKKSIEHKAGVYLGAGVNRWSNVHIADLANLYLLAMEKAPSASYFYAENGEESYKDIAGFVSEALGYGGKIQSWLAEDALAELGDWARFALGSNSRVRAVHATNLLGWKPSHESLADWIKNKQF